MTFADPTCWPRWSSCRWPSSSTSCSPAAAAVLPAAPRTRRCGRTSCRAGPAGGVTSPPRCCCWRWASLLVGAARPQAMMASDQKETTVVLAVDTSNSMAATDVHPSRIAAARAAAQRSHQRAPKNAKVGLVSFARDVQVAARAHGRPRRHQRLAATPHAERRHRARDPRSTARVASLKASHSRRQGPRDRRHLRRQEHRGQALAARRRTAAKAAGVRVFTVSLGTAGGTVKEAGKTVNVPPDPTTLRRVAAAAGGRFFRAADATSLSNAYAHRQRGQAPAQEARHQLRLHGGRRGPDRRWQPALAGLVPPPDLTGPPIRSTRTARRVSQDLRALTSTCSSAMTGTLIATVGRHPPSPWSAPRVLRDLGATSFAPHRLWRARSKTCRAPPASQQA